MEDDHFETVQAELQGYAGGFNVWGEVLFSPGALRASWALALVVQSM